MKKQRHDTLDTLLKVVPTHTNTLALPDLLKTMARLFMVLD